MLTPVSRSLTIFRRKLHPFARHERGLWSAIVLAVCRRSAQQEAAPAAVGARINRDCQAT
jgi:hypothetical protein